MVSLVISAIVYEAVGLSGYLCFGADAKGNILASFAKEDAGNPAMIIANVGVSVALVFSLPIVLWPFRSCTISVYNFYRSGTIHLEPTATQWRVVTCALISIIV